VPRPGRRGRPRKRPDSLTGDKAYAAFTDPEVDLPKAPRVDPFADDPVDIEDKVVALLKP